MLELDIFKCKDEGLVRMHLGTQFLVCVNWVLLERRSTFSTLTEDYRMTNICEPQGAVNFANS